jgi:hypothetical protein
MNLVMSIPQKDLVGSRLPTGYGVAYQEYVRDNLVLAIVPLNLIIRYGLRVKWALYRVFYSGNYKDTMRKAYDNGYRVGMADAYKDRLHHWRDI